jgi:hypothetical protein
MWRSHVRFRGNSGIATLFLPFTTSAFCQAGPSYIFLRDGMWDFGRPQKQFFKDISMLEKDIGGDGGIRTLDTAFDRITV